MGEREAEKEGRKDGGRQTQRDWGKERMIADIASPNGSPFL